MSQSLPIVKVALYFDSKKFELDPITEALQLAPTSIRTKQDYPKVIRENNDLPDNLKPKNSWCYEIIKADCYTVNEAISELLSNIIDKTSILKILSKKLLFDATLVIAIKASEEHNPIIEIDSINLSILNELSASILFDLYNY